MYYIISDLHLNHKNLCLQEYNNRPLGYEQKIINNLYSTLTKDDTLVCLGDVYWYECEVYIEQIKALPCYKILIRGNHDRESNNWYLNNGFDFVCEGLSIKYAKLNIYFSHKPRYDLERAFDIIIHGHLHDNNHRDKDNQYCKHPKNFLVAVEYLKYTCINLDKLLRQFGDNYTHASF